MFSSTARIFIMLCHFSVDLAEANMEKVPGLDGTQIGDIATGAEHSVLVTGKMWFSSCS